MDAFVLGVWSAKSEDPNLSPMADDTITRDGIQGLGSPLYICGPCTSYKVQNHHTINKQTDRCGPLITTYLPSSHVPCVLAEVVLLSPCALYQALGPHVACPPVVQGHLDHQGHLGQGSQVLGYPYLGHEDHPFLRDKKDKNTMLTLKAQLSVPHV